MNTLVREKLATHFQTYLTLVAEQVKRDCPHESVDSELAEEIAAEVIVRAIKGCPSPEELDDYLSSTTNVVAEGRLKRFSMPSEMRAALGYEAPPSVPEFGAPEPEAAPLSGPAGGSVTPALEEPLQLEPEDSAPPPASMSEPKASTPEPTLDAQEAFDFDDDDWTGPNPRHQKPEERAPRGEHSPTEARADQEASAEPTEGSPTEDAALGKLLPSADAPRAVAESSETDIAAGMGTDRPTFEPEDAATQSRNALLPAHPDAEIAEPEASPFEERLTDAPPSRATEGTARGIDEDWDMDLLDPESEAHSEVASTSEPDNTVDVRGPELDDHTATTVVPGRRKRENSVPAGETVSSVPADASAKHTALPKAGSDTREHVPDPYGGRDVAITVKPGVQRSSVRVFESPPVPTPAPDSTRALSTSTSHQRLDAPASDPEVSLASESVSAPESTKALTVAPPSPRTRHAFEAAQANGVPARFPIEVLASEDRSPAPDDLTQLSLCGFPDNPLRAARLCLVALADELGVDGTLALSFAPEVCSQLESLTRRHQVPEAMGWPRAPFATEWQRVARRACLRALFTAAQNASR